MNNNSEGNDKKALIVTTVASTLDQFCMNDISILQKSHKVYVAANFNSGNNTSKERIKVFKADLQKKNISLKEVKLNRNPLSKQNYIAYKEIKRLIESHSFDIIHCHTPVAAMVARLAAFKVNKNNLKVIYTAHGFHFYNGAPLKNWLLYYPVERWLARYTDVLITINKEDYSRAENFFKAKKIEYVPGVGIEINRFRETVVNKSEKRRELGIPEDAFVVLSVGELNNNKNHETIIKSISKLDNSNIYYLICGQGSIDDYLKQLSRKLGQENQIKLLGYRSDIAEICKVADIFAFPSKREGLGLAALEAMASGLPIVTSNVHGIVDYSIDNVTGFTCNPTDIEGFAASIEKLLRNDELRISIGEYNKKAVEKYDANNYMAELERIYRRTNAINYN